MTRDDYNTALSPKVHGTINLHEAFSSHDLAFFISLSSISGILGMTGQSNYAAGNTFQDAFAHAYSTAHPHTRYITLDIGPIEGTKSITQLPKGGIELERQSSIIMTFDELFMVLEYAMSPHSLADAPVQCICGFDRSSMEDVDDRVIIDNPIFGLVPYHHGKLGQSARGAVVADKIEDLGSLLQAVRSLDEAEVIIANATAEKFSAFLDMDVPTDVPIAKLALDSLVSVELKNWMVRTLKAPLQPSELAGAMSIAALAKLLTSRSTLVSDEIHNVKESGIRNDTEAMLVHGSLTKKRQETNAETQVNGSSSDTSPHGWACCKHSKQLPKYPLVDLDDALDYFLQNTEHFCSQPEFETLQQAVGEVRGRAGRRAYAELVKRYYDPQLDSWMYDLITDAVHLKRKHPIAPYSNVMGLYFDSKLPHTQSERAAVIAVAAWKFKQSVDTYTAEPFWHFGMPTCNWQLPWLFNAARIPGVEGDIMRMYEGDYCVVLRKGHVFKVMLKEGGEDVSYDKLKATFEAILEHVSDEGKWVGILTTDVRDSWALVS